MNILRDWRSATTTAKAHAATTALRGKTFAISRALNRLSTRNFTNITRMSLKSGRRSQSKECLFDSIEENRENTDERKRTTANIAAPWCQAPREKAARSNGRGLKSDAGRDR